MCANAPPPPARTACVRVVRVRGWESERGRAGMFCVMPPVSPFSASIQGRPGAHAHTHTQPWLVWGGV